MWTEDATASGQERAADHARTECSNVLPSVIKSGSTQESLVDIKNALDRNPAN
jgi:hypothetical protein